MPRPRSFDEDAVIRACRTAFRKRGYSATSLDDLTAATGLGRGSIYGSFGDKHSIFMRALNSYCEEILGRVQAELHQTGVPAVQRLSNHILGIASGLVSGSASKRCFMAQSAAELAASDREVGARARATLAAWHEALASVIVEAQKDRAISPDAEPEALASMLLAVLRGIDALRVQGGSASVITAAARQALALLPLASTDD